ncbi:predicted protein [Sclerotinia sclerotiorum 1980 UF-70]|uniref:Uncharacterized protein n=1 Tax=Sclerotinia sclerotiorum (strain ATCC 18683 / 1980 / Ss-1) TaxID=665079 RepID=A7EQP9_SCLS1|nr:predicted protein [Sclerotinia sclerotiorum 1980 UF-70]EDN91791.1 predicted protein [Sclerotinia sclerotiorum 1980 UF-70]
MASAERNPIMRLKEYAGQAKAGSLEWLYTKGTSRCSNEHDRRNTYEYEHP